jgi:tetratricopeptide (TPR) repeat protein
MVRTQEAPNKPEEAPKSPEALRPQDMVKPQEAAVPGIPNIVDSNSERSSSSHVNTIADEAARRRAAYSPAIAQKPKVLVLKVSKGFFATEGKPGEIIKELDQAIRVHPSDPDLMYERAKAYIQIDKFSNALNDLSDAIIGQPNKSEYYIARAWCYKKLGNSYLAADDLKQARVVDPSLPPQIDLLQNAKNLTAGSTEHPE